MVTKSGPVFGAVFFLLITVFSPTSLFAEEVVGTVAALLGKAYVTKIGAKEVLLVKRGDNTHFLDTYETKAKSRLKVLFEDDSIITLGENTKISITENLYNPREKKRSTTIKMVSGSLRVLVGKGFAASKSKFEVHTPTSMAAARGTYFIVWLTEEAGKQHSHILVLEGKVEVSQNALFSPPQGEAPSGGKATPGTADIADSTDSQSGTHSETPPGTGDSAAGGSVILGQGQAVSMGEGTGNNLGAVGVVQSLTPDAITQASASTEVSELFDQTARTAPESNMEAGSNTALITPDHLQATPLVIDTTESQKEGRTQVSDLSQLEAAAEDASLEESPRLESVVAPPGADTPNNTLLNTHINLRVPVK
jgi:hypothetical protein